MQNLTNSPNLIDRWLRYRFQTILVICFLIWTLLLVAKTLQVQHSCYPMIHGSSPLPAECQAKVSPQPDRHSSKKPTQGDRPKAQKPVAPVAPSKPRPAPKPSPTPPPQKIDKSPSSQQPEKPNPIAGVIKTAQENPDLTGGVIAIGVASTVAVVASVPLAIAVGIGAAVWFVVRTAL